MNKKLYRSQKERMIGGVCGGLAEYFNIDPTLVRLAFVILAIAGGPGILIYLVLLMLVPEATTQNSYVQKQPQSSVSEEDVVVVDENGNEI
jgi:phage shock protein C